MRLVSYVVLLFTAWQLLTCQETTSNYERGTVMAVVRHGTESSEPVQYDVSIQIRDKLYIVLYTPPSGSNSVEYAPGLDFLFLVGKNTLTFPSKVTGTTQVPILRTETIATKPGIDWSRIYGQYFEMKMQNLSDNLGLTETQRAQVKPIVEQEAGMAKQQIFSPVLSREERLKRWEKIVGSSDAELKPILSEEQWQRLKELRDQEKGEVKELIAKQESGNK
jgi:hypothetical protein